MKDIMPPRRPLTLLVCLALLVCRPCDARAQDDHLSSAVFAALYPARDPFVKKYIQRSGEGMNRLKKSHAEILAFMGYVLVSKGLPRELRNLAVIESGLDNRIVSSAGAVGPWQFMPRTAGEYGLLINDSIDERCDIYKSTFAATKMLHRLYARYHDWDLVVAAYNCGIGRVDQAIAQSGSKYFDSLQYYLPAESRKHVKKFIGTSYVMDRTVLSGMPVVQEKDTGRPDLVRLAQNGLGAELIGAGFRLKDIAERLEISLPDLESRNIGFERSVAKNGYSWLIIPLDKLASFRFFKNGILQASIQQDINQEKQKPQTP